MLKGEEAGAEESLFDKKSEKSYSKHSIMRSFGAMTFDSIRSRTSSTNSSSSSSSSSLPIQAAHRFGQLICLTFEALSRSTEYEWDSPVYLQLAAMLHAAPLQFRGLGDVQFCHLHHLSTFKPNCAGCSSNERVPPAFRDTYFQPCSVSSEHAVGSVKANRPIVERDDIEAEQLDWELSAAVPVRSDAGSFQGWHVRVRAHLS